MVNGTSQKTYRKTRPIENRVAVRKDTYLKAAELIVGEDKVKIPASVLDASDRGLRLYVNSSDPIPQRFKVILFSPPSTHNCELVWQNKQEIGLKFIS